MPKRTNLSISLGLKDGSDKVAKVSILPSGEIVIFDIDGNKVNPEYKERSVHYDRQKANLAREQTLTEDQEARKLKAKRQSPERTE